MGTDHKVTAKTGHVRSRNALATAAPVGRRPTIRAAAVVVSGGLPLDHVAPIPTRSTAPAAPDHCRSARPHHPAHRRADQSRAAGLPDLAAAQRQREKVTVIGDLWTNGLGSPVGLANATSVFDAISQMVALTEAAQGVSAGQGRIVVLGRHRTTASGYSGDPATDQVEIADAQLKAAFPNYFCKFSEALWQAGAPDGPYPDAAAFANQAAPTVLRSDGTHPTGQGYQVQGQYIAAFIKSKGWDRP